MKLQLVISGFPGAGKTTVYNNPPEGLTIADSDSSCFSWITDENGTKVRNPNFIKDYIEHIKTILPENDIIFVSSHEDVRKALLAEGIRFILVYPVRELQSQWVERLKRRGSPQAFLDLIDSNYQAWIEDLEKFAQDNSVLTMQITQPTGGMLDILSGAYQGAECNLSSLS